MDSPCELRFIFQKTRQCLQSCFQLVLLHNVTTGMLGVLQDGHLVFVNDDQNGPPEQVFIGRRSRKRFDDYRWHKLKIRRNGRRVSFLYRYICDFLFPSGHSFPHSFSSPDLFSSLNTHDFLLLLVTPFNIFILRSILYIYTMTLPLCTHSLLPLQADTVFHLHTVFHLQICSLA